MNAVVVLLGALMNGLKFVESLRCGEFGPSPEVPAGGAVFIRTRAVSSSAWSSFPGPQRMGVGRNLVCWSLEGPTVSLGLYLNFSGVGDRVVVVMVETLAEMV